MYFGKKTVGGTYEILAADDFFAIPMEIQEAAADENGIVKAGSPVTSDGNISLTGAGAIGILLYDVNTNENPNGAVVTIGYIDWGKCKELSGATANAETMHGLIPAITFRENIGIVEGGA